MFPVDVDCASCGTHISELPFQPSGDRPVYCSNCLREKRQTRGGGSGSGSYGGGARPQRQMYDVNLTCADCGKAITQLPFQPSGDRPVYCSDCNRNRRAA